MAEVNGKPIVVAVDGSNPGWEAMETALYLARLLERPLDVLTVIQRRKAGYFAFIDRHLEEEQHTYGQKVLDEAVARAQKAGVEVRTHRLEGETDIHEAIIVYLEAAGPVKFMVMGSHGHGFVSRHILGSVTERVIREIAYRGLPVPVLVVPAPKGVEVGPSPLGSAPMA
jgi:nucleotide-binding universal stress UspA family protein